MQKKRNIKKYENYLERAKGNDRKRRSCDDTQIVVKVRNNSTEDYSENNIRAFLNDNGVLIIQDEFSF